MHLFLFAGLLVGIALPGGCRKEIAAECAIPCDTSQSISFIPRIDGEITRGTPVNHAAGLVSMGVFCADTKTADWSDTASFNKMFNQLLNNNANVWTYQGADVFWNTSKPDNRYSFFAYTPYAAAGNGITVNGSATSQGKPALSYVVPADVVKQPDLMLAVPRYNIRPTGNAVALQMKHTLTCVGFQVAGDGEQITGISLSGVSTTGDVLADGNNIVWTNLGAPVSVDFTASLNYDAGEDYFTASGTMSTQLIASDGYLMMIPQDLGGNAKIKITFKDNTSKEISLDMYTWEAGKRVTYYITLIPAGTIIVTPEVMVLPSREVTATTDNIEVVCQKNNGSPNPVAPWTLMLDPADRFRISLNPGDTYHTASTIVSGTGSATVYLFAPENTTGVDILAAVYMDGNKIVDIKQLKMVVSPTDGGTPPVKTTTYAGAFWRAAETGERVIRINAGNSNGNLGAWNAWVAWFDQHWDSDDGVILAAGDSPDPNIYTDAPGDAERFKVEGSASAIGGTVTSNGYITFRIGMKRPFTTYHAENNPARYAVVLLSYGTPAKVQKIFLRQGEGADYVMSPGDAISSGGMNAGTRPLAAKFSPYNLTAPAMTGGGNSVTDHPQLALCGGTFTRYPTQAGAFFQWTVNAATHYRRAFHPVNTSGPMNGSTRWSTVAPSGFWDEVSVFSKVCPAGYHRPNDGPVNAGATNAVHLSETRQSLLYKPMGLNSRDNMVWGYYADGFFDRRVLGGTNNSSVSSTTSGNNLSANVAYAGFLLINPVATSDHYNTSLFFPASGYRNANKGALKDNGNSGRYWTTGLVGNVIGVNSFNASQNGLYLSTSEKYSGYMIRCVKD